MPLIDDTRAAWKARPALRGGFPTVTPAKRVGRMWHWDGDSPLGLHAKPHTACLARVLQDQAFHQNSREWRDIGYPVLICPHGRVIEGAGIDAIAAHCAGFNTSDIGIQLMVGRGDPLTPAMLARAVQFATDTDARCGHRLVDRGHRDGFATSCPGDAIYAWVRAGGPRKDAAPAAEQDWFDMATKQDLRDVLMEPAFLREVARYVLTGYATGPDGNQRVLSAHLAQLDALTRVSIQAAADDLTPEQVTQAVSDAIAAGARVEGDLKIVPRDAS